LPTAHQQQGALSFETKGHGLLIWADSHLLHRRHVWQPDSHDGLYFSLLQVQSLARLGWFLTAGTASQQCAILLVLVRC
jgi:hypothetical protein